MTSLVLYSIGIFIIAAIFSFLAARNFIWGIGGSKVNINVNVEWQLLGYFWLAAAFIWIFQAAGDIAHFLGRDDIDFLFGTLAQAPVWFQVVDGFFYVTLLIVIRMSLVKKLSLLYWAAAAIFFYSFLTYDIKHMIGPIETDWGSEYKMVGLSLYILLFVFIFGVLLLLAALTVKTVQYFKKRLVLDKLRLLLLISILIYTLSGASEEIGWWPGWTMLLIRIIILIPTFIVYLVSSSEQSNESGARRKSVDN